MGAFSGLATFGLTILLANPTVLDGADPLSGLKARLAQAQPGARVMKATDHAGVALVTGLRYRAPGESAQVKAESFLAAFPALTRGLTLVHERTSEAGQTVVHFHQWHAGQVVFDRTATIAFDQSGRVRSLNSDAAPIYRTQGATIDAQHAEDLAREYLSKDVHNQFPIAEQSTVKRGYVVLGGQATEVFEVHTARAPLTEHLVVRVDAHLGRIIGVRNTVIH